jgi:hypothetical protein
MGCGCAERSVLIGKAVAAARRGDVEAVKTAWARMAALTAADARLLRAEVTARVTARLAALRGR